MNSTKAPSTPITHCLFAPTCTKSNPASKPRKPAPKINERFVTSVGAVLFTLKKRRARRARPVNGEKEIPVRFAERFDWRHRLASPQGRPRRSVLHRQRKEQDIADGFVPNRKIGKKTRSGPTSSYSTDTLGQGAKAQALRASGKPVIGGTPYTDNLEDDRSFGQEELKALASTSFPTKTSAPLTKQLSSSRKIPIATSSSPAEKRRTSSAASL